MHNHALLEHGQKMAFARLTDGQDTSKHRYLWLDAGRGVAAIIVMLYHYQEFIGAPRLFKFGYLAVDLFFMMSGFVLVHAYGAKLQKGMTELQYIVARLIRLYPVYFFATAFGASYYFAKIVLGTDDAPLLGDLFMILIHNLLFLPFAGEIAEPTGIFPFSPASWSLSSEVVLSVLFGIILWKIRSQTLILTALVAGLICIFFAVRFGTLDFGFSMPGFFPAMFRALAEFAIGMWLYKQFSGLRVKSMLAPLVLLAFIAITLSVAVPSWWMSVVLIALIFPLFLVAQPTVEPTGAVASLFSNLGRLSYPVYLIHTPMLLWGAGLSKFMGQDPQILAPMLGLGLAVCTLAISWAAAALFDEPVRGWLTRRS